MLMLFPAPLPLTLPFLPAQLLNGLALFFALAGGWLLIATRAREQRAQARLAGDGEGELEDEQAWALDAATARVNRFFYCFGGATLLLALLLSWSSTRL